MNWTAVERELYQACRAEGWKEEGREGGEEVRGWGGEGGEEGEGKGVGDRRWTGIAEETDDRREESREIRSTFQLQTPRLGMPLDHQLH